MQTFFVKNNKQTMKKAQNGFTLLELMLTVGLIFAIVVSAFIPYSFKQSKARVKISTKILTETISEARNLAINGFDFEFIPGTKNNTSVWVLIEEGNNKPFKIFLYKQDIGDSDIKWETESEKIVLYKEKLVQHDTGLSSIKYNGDEKSKVLVYFEAITGKTRVFDESWNEVSTSQIDFVVAHKAASTAIKKEVNYFPITNVVDY